MVDVSNLKVTHTEDIRGKCVHMILYIFNII